jgi:import receptor subunit TOM20
MDLTNTDVSETESHLRASMGIDEDARPSTGPPSETSSQEWDKVTDPGSRTPV